MFRFAPTLLLLVACGQPDGEQVASTDNDTHQALRAPPVVDGCGDIHVYAANAADTVAMFITIRGDLALDAATNMQPAILDVQLPHPDVTLMVQRGGDLTINECNDVIYGQPVITAEAEPVAGRLRALITPIDYFDPWYYPTDVDIRLIGVEIEDDGGRGATLPDMQLPTVRVGWFPG